MIFDSLVNFGKYLTLNPHFSVVEEFMKSNDLDKLTPGKQKITEDVFVISETVPGKGKYEAVLEAHKDFIDVQLCRNAVDNMGWTSLEDCKTVKVDYNEERDLIFYDDSIEKHIAVGRENFVIFFPWDAHAPNIGSGELRKVIFKVRAV